VPEPVVVKNETKRETGLKVWMKWAKSFLKGITQ